MGRESSQPYGREYHIPRWNNQPGQLHRVLPGHGDEVDASHPEPEIGRGDLSVRGPDVGNAELGQFSHRLQSHLAVEPHLPQGWRRMAEDSWQDADVRNARLGGFA